MNSDKIIQHISNWLLDYSNSSKTDGFVIGVSGGIDSAVTSTLCAMTGKKVLCLEIPIHQAASQVTRAHEHIAWLKNRYNNVSDLHIELTQTFEQFKNSVDIEKERSTVDLSLANTRARLRMTTLYYYAGLHKLLVAGTGNKVEDFGIGFFTKYGDGGVDISPIADLMKTEVYAIACEMKIIESIQKAAPTDGLFGDSRTDEDQIGASYGELEWAMNFIDQWTMDNGQWTMEKITNELITERQKQVLKIYSNRHNANKHKMIPIPICIIPDDLKK